MKTMIMHKLKYSRMVNFPQIRIPKLLRAWNFFKTCSFLQSTDPLKTQIRNSWKKQHFTFYSVNETAVKTGHLLVQGTITAQRSGVWIVGGGERSWRRKCITNGKEGGQNYRLHRFAQGRPLGRGFVCLLYFPWALSVITITAHWFSILSINTFIGHSDIIKISLTVSSVEDMSSLKYKICKCRYFFFLLLQKRSSHISNNTDSA